VLLNERLVLYSSAVVSPKESVGHSLVRFVILFSADVTLVIRFLDDYRAEYEHTLSKLIDHRIDLKIFKFDAERQSPQEIANQLLVELDLKLKTSVDQKC